MALKELGRGFEEPFEVEMPFDMENCSEEGLRDLSVSSTLTFGIDCLEQVTLKSWRKSFEFFFFLCSSVRSELSKACSKKKKKKEKKRKENHEANKRRRGAKKQRKAKKEAVWTQMARNLSI